MICCDMHLSHALEIISTSDAKPFTGHETYCMLKTRVCCLRPKLCIQHTGNEQALPINNTHEQGTALRAGKTAASLPVQDCGSYRP